MLYLFDFDGTLISPRIYAETREAIIDDILKEKQWTSDELIRFIKKKNVKINRDRKVDTGELCKALGLEKLYYKHLEAALKRHKATNPTATVVLKALAAKGKKIGIASNALHETIALFTRVYKVEKEVSIIFGKDDAGAEKWQRAYWEKLIAMYDLPAKDCMIIGDSWEEDVVMPGKLGFQSFFLKEGKKLSDLLKFVP